MSRTTAATATSTWWVPSELRPAWNSLPRHSLTFGSREGALSLDFPEPRLADMETLVSAVLAAQERLSRTPAEEVIDALARAAASFAPPAGARRSLALDLLSSVTQRSRAMCEDSLDFLLSKLTRPALRHQLETAMKNDRLRVVCPRLVFHVLAGNIPWAGVESLVAAVLARAASVVKLSSREPVFAGLFAQAIAEADARIGDALAILQWPRGEQALEEEVVAEADAAVVYGDNSTVASYSQRLAWRVAAGQMNFVRHGHRVSAAILGPRARSGEEMREIANRLAIDFALEDQEGCLSPHVAYMVVGGAGDPVERFAERLAESLEKLQGRWPARPLAPSEAAAIHQARGAAEMRGARVIAPEGSTRWTVVLDPNPGFEPCPLGRFTRIVPVPAIDSAIDALLPARGMLSTIGIDGFESGSRRELVERLADLAPDRVCSIGRMQRPPLGWNHDGRPDLEALLRWMEVEGSRKESS